MSFNIIKCGGVEHNLSAVPSSPSGHWTENYIDYVRNHGKPPVIPARLPDVDVLIHEDGTVLCPALNGDICHRVGGSPAELRQARCAYLKPDPERKK